MENKMISKCGSVMFAALLSLICFNACVDVSTESNKSEAAPKQAKGKLLLSDNKTKPVPKVDDKNKPHYTMLSVAGYPKSIAWKMRIEGVRLNGSIIGFSPSLKSAFSMTSQSRDVLKKDGRKTEKIVSNPFKIGPDTFVLIQEASTIKSTAGVFFRIRMKNVGKITTPAADIQFFFSMKGKKFITRKGEDEIKSPYRMIRDFGNWVFMPSSKGKGLALISNFAAPGVSFTSNFMRSNKNGNPVKSIGNSRWGIRKLGQGLKPGQENELVFAFLAADSPEETVRLSEKLRTEKIFPELKLPEGASSVLKVEKKVVEKPKKESDVKPILDPKSYSAENTAAKTIDEWTKRELKPELYDIWLGKKNRIDLNGSWKLLKLAGTRYMPNCDYGIKHGFEKSDFDDSKWFNQPVPLSWNFTFEDCKKSIKFFAGVGWYRKKFNVPGNLKGKRIILCFPGIDQESTVYVNGQKMGDYKTLNIEHSNSIFRMRYEYYELDITDAVKFGAENSLAVRIYDNGLIVHGSQKSHPEIWKRLQVRHSGIGGIWQEVYLESRSGIYLKKAMVSFNFRDSTAHVKAYVVNTNNVEVKEKLRWDFSPWKSSRYSLAKGKSFSKAFGEQTLKPGLNDLTFKIKLKKPELWSPERPFLYEMKLSDDKKNVLGMERVGFREFSAGKDYFILNGKRITLRGQQSTWGSYGSMFTNMEGAFNNRWNIIEKWFDKYKGLNHNVARNHSTFYPHSFYDIADEKGILIFTEQFFRPEAFDPKKGLFDKYAKMTGPYRAKIKKTAEQSLRHPCIVAFSLGNELYDSKLLGAPIDFYQYYLDQVYDEFKKHNKDTLVCASGRQPTMASLKKTGAKPRAISKTHAKTDFYATHNYEVAYEDPEFAEDDEWPCAFKKYKEAYALDGGPKVMWNTESVISSIPTPDSRIAFKWDKMLRKHMKNGLLDRSWFAENWSYIDSPGGFSSFSRRWSVPKFGFLGMLKGRAMPSQAGFMKRITELHRRKRQYVAGVIGNCPMIFKKQMNIKNKNVDYNKPVASAVKKANQPVLACLDGKWNRNIFSGKNPATPLYVMNDHEGDISNVNVAVSLRALDAKIVDLKLKSVDAGTLTPAEMKVIDYAFEIPENIGSGHYSVILTVDYKLGTKELQSINDYRTFILNRKDIKLNAAAKNKIAVLRGAGDGPKLTTGILKQLNVAYTPIDSVKNLAEFKILLLPSYCETFPKGIGEWVKNGGKLLCLEQSEMPDGIPQKTCKNERYGYMAELILPTHPILAGLEQSDFRYWNGKREKIENKWVSDYSLIPLNEGVIASQVTKGYRVGMNIDEYRMRKGVCLLSQMDAVKRFGSDSVATKYLINVLNYCIGDWTAPGTPVLKENQAFSGPAFKVDPQKAFYVDIRPACTMGFADEKAKDKKGGWTDQGPNNDLRNLPLGKHTFNGVPFEIIDPKSNNGKSCIVLRGAPKTGTGFLPVKRRLNLNCKAEKLYFLVSAAWASVDKTIGNINIQEEADGTEITAFFQINLVPGKNVSDWWDSYAKLPGSELGWTGNTAGDNKHEIGSFIIEWINPYPRKIIQYIEFESTEIAVPAILAVTGVK